MIHAAVLRGKDQAAKNAVRNSEIEDEEMAAREREIARFKSIVTARRIPME